MTFTFTLGTHLLHWLWLEDPRLDGVTLCVSRNRAARRKTPFPPARRDFVLDSGMFTHLQKYGSSPITNAEWAAEASRYIDQLGHARCLWVAPLDHMCEPEVIYGGTLGRLTFHGTRTLRGVRPGDREQDLDIAVGIHQELTVASLVELRRLAPHVPWMPVLQGWTVPQYLRCARLYEEAGIDLRAEPIVGLGSVCRRQHTSEIAALARIFHEHGVALHGFGVKTDGLLRYGTHLASSDSLAWSYGAANGRIKLPGCTHRAKTCSNCLTYALKWRADVIRWPERAAALNSLADDAFQPELFDAAA
ncbi:deazapurine DNA modification protein DpdA family protein [Streptomyces xiamenensis]|uniref:deazapurine DNA modification protein DpdA family protein n=1 Tax=Streptomyces xiamenensis TaxID=408015 RepID=UPI0035D919A9